MMRLFSQEAQKDEYSHFASGSGSNFQALVDDEFIKPYVKLLVCDKPNAYVLERANKHDIPVFF